MVTYFRDLWLVDKTFLIGYHILTINDYLFLIHEQMLLILVIKLFPILLYHFYEQYHLKIISQNYESYNVYCMTHFRWVIPGKTARSNNFKSFICFSISSCFGYENTFAFSFDNSSPFQGSQFFQNSHFCTEIRHFYWNWDFDQKTCILE